METTFLYQTLFSLKTIVNLLSRMGAMTGLTCDSQSRCPLAQPTGLPAGISETTFLSLLLYILCYNRRFTVYNYFNIIGITIVCNNMISPIINKIKNAIENFLSNFLSFVLYTAFVTSSILFVGVLPLRYNKTESVPETIIAIIKIIFSI